MNSSPRCERCRKEGATVHVTECTATGDAQGVRQTSVTGSYNYCESCAREVGMLGADLDGIPRPDNCLYCGGFIAPESRRLPQSTELPLTNMCSDCAQEFTRRLVQEIPSLATGDMKKEDFEKLGQALPKVEADMKRWIEGQKGRN